MTPSKEIDYKRVLDIISRWYARYDLDGDQCIERQELVIALRREGCTEAYIQSFCDTIFANWDTQKDQVLTFAELYALALSLSGV